MSCLASLKTQTNTNASLTDDTSGFLYAGLANGTPGSRRGSNINADLANDTSGHAITLDPIHNRWPRE
eukprot:5158148-Lingulodinium_polyedra.AAC.1